MHLLIVCRHGNYETVGGVQRLTERGRAEVSALAGTILRLTNENDRITLLSSTAPRATESAEIVREKLGLTAFERLEDLSIEYGVNEEAALQIVDARAAETDVLVVMTHLEYARQIPVHMAKRLGLLVRERDLQTGTAQAIFLNEKRVRIL